MTFTPDAPFKGAEKPDIVRFKGDDKELNCHSIFGTFPSLYLYTPRYLDKSRWLLFVVRNLLIFKVKKLVFLRVSALSNFKKVKLNFAESVLRAQYVRIASV
ncbi:hypothetical protein, partial [Photobacterium frigidiphilum]|uniref:hypothetical protein n=1 Tax=Photobacterium frigidiphilum TaxID=264736 RepID=UPI001D130C0D